MRFARIYAWSAAMAAACSALGGLVDKAPGVTPDTYVDFPANGSRPFEVVVSNVCDAAGGTSVKRFMIAPDAGGETNVVVGFRRYRGICALYSDGHEIGRFTDESTAPVHVLIDEASEADGDLFVQRLAPFAFADAFMVAEGDKTGLMSWEKLAGEWSLHAVTGRTVHANERQKLSKFPTQAKSPNFYCLSGFGEDALIIAGEDFHSHYSIRAAVHQDGGTNGIAFMATDDGAFTFTSQQNPDTGRLDFVLRRGCVAGETPGEFVAGVETELAPGQWYMLEARLTDGEAICYVDGVAVIRHSLALPAGGRFGLYAKTGEAHPARFDDVAAATWCGADFALADGAPNTAKSMSFGVADDPPAAITLPATLHQDAVLELGVGSATNASATLRIERHGPIGYAMYLMDGSGATNDMCTFEEMNGFASTIRAHGFSLEATSPGFIDGRVDGVTYVTMRMPEPPAGKAWYRIDNPHGIGYPSVTHGPSAYTDRFEKNKFFVDDLFMRHWASTEGQWLTMTNGLVWYKDDVLSRVSLTLPGIDGIDLGLGVTEDGEGADARIVCATNVLTVFGSFATNAPPLFSAPYPPAAMVGETGAMTVTNRFTVRLDGRRLSVVTPGGEYFRANLVYPHGGRRMLFRKAPKRYTLNVFVHREPVIDCLFDESLHDWTINGGTWEVVNRFQCRPEWSHMNGENGDGLAALWSKYDVGGDFCATFVCGMRHGWYDRVGDFDMTILNRSHTPSQGYTLKITEWDQNHSQRRSRLLRDGELLAETDAQVAPRIRDGNIRTGYEPLVAKGRDVHGAWYTVKLRRMGNRLEAYFDNIPVFSVDDPKPLDSGSFGVWTYRNSMVVARVRIAAERIAPHRFSFSPIQPPNSPTIQLSNSPTSQLPNSPTPQLSNSPTPLPHFSGLPVDMLRPELWHAADEVSCPSISFSQEEGETVMTVTSVNGSGSFLASPILADVTASQLAGWSFEVARSPDALFNLEFSLADEAVTNRYSHVICGEREGRDRRRFSGFSPEPPPTPDGAAKVWTPMTAWLPATGADPRKQLVMLEGFGNLRPGDVQQGLKGNAPGTWYAIRRMRPIYRDEPQPDNSADNEAAFAHEVQVALRGGVAGRLNSFKVPASICPSEPTILWTLPPADNQGLIAEYLPYPTNVIRVSSTLPWPNPLISAQEVTVGGGPAPLARVEDNALVIPFQRPLKIGTSPVKVTFKTAGGGRPFTQLLPAASFADEAEHIRVASVILDGATGAMYESFETRTTVLGPYSHGGMTPVPCFGDDETSSFIRLDNNGRDTRLSANLAPVFDLASTPLVAFRYRGDDMAIVNISTRQNIWHHFGDDPSTNRAVLDGKWHKSLRLLTDMEVEVKPSEAASRTKVPLVLSSRGTTKQPNANHTGLYSSFDLDDIVIGPALGPTNIFGFHATFTAPVSRAEYAVIADGEDEAAAKWIAAEAATNAPDQWTATVITATRPPDLQTSRPPNLQTTRPPDLQTTRPPDLQTTKLPDGIHHLLIRGVGANGNPSDVADIPFLYDTTPPKVTISTSQEPMTLSMSFGKTGSPPVLDGFSLKADGDKITVRSRDDEKVKFNKDNSLVWRAQWARLAREQIQKHKDGEKVVFEVSGIRDGAGNEAPPAAATNVLDYASDKCPPSWSANYPWVLRGGDISAANSFFGNFGKDLKIKCEPGKEHTRNILSITTADKFEAKPQITATFKVAGMTWNSASNRWLVIRARLPEGNPAPTNMAFRLTFSVEHPPTEPNGKPKEKSHVMKIPSAKPSDADRPAGLHGSCDFQPGKWCVLTIDVDAFIRKETGLTDGRRINAIYMRLPEITKYALELDYVAILKGFADPAKPIPVTAYDRSGLDGMYARGKKVSDGLKAPTPDDLYKALPGVRLADITIRDRAGNETSGSVTVPLPPR